ncbi:hypothetical protein BDC45DRAFT_517324 [Circinella umbellata]|nr:hypothetical protein BDC45DRAFT_517324 [Circinella umbellata]
MLADNTKKVILRWTNKMDEVTLEIRADAIIETLIQSRSGRHSGYGEVNLAMVMPPHDHFVWTL